MNLTSDQNSFLTKYSIALSEVFDASGMMPKAYRPIMNDLGMIIAVGVSPCDKGGHTMRWRNGRCAQCKGNTRDIAFRDRLYATGDVYVAQSLSGGLVKIGTASDVRQRILTLNNYGYGGVDDWRLFNVIRCDGAGRIEFEAHSRLLYYRVSRSYTKLGMTVNCQELFSCEPDLAYDMIIKVIDHLEVMPKERIPGLKRATAGSIGLGDYRWNPLPEQRSYMKKSPKH